MSVAPRSSEGTLDIAPLATGPSLTAPVCVAGRRLTPTPVFDTYWRFAAARQTIYEARLAGSLGPWTDDSVLASYRFTNVFRASDRVSQFLIRYVQRTDSACELVDQVFRTLLFKIFNREDTWADLERLIGPVQWRTYEFSRYRSAFDRLATAGPIYSAAYVMPPPRCGEDRKHANHLRLLERMMRGGIVGLVRSSASLEALYQALLPYPGVGPFLAFQYAIDLNYLDAVSHDEDGFVVAGPGARDGIRKCFGRDATGIEAEVIRYMVDSQDQHFARLGLQFRGLFGRRLHLIDAQNLFCEVDKYARMLHPDVAGISGRTRIKQRYMPARPLASPMFPSAWHLQPAEAIVDR